MTTPQQCFPISRLVRTKLLSTSDLASIEILQSQASEFPTTMSNERGKNSSPLIVGSTAYHRGSVAIRLVASQSEPTW